LLTSDLQSTWCSSQLEPCTTVEAGLNQSFEVKQQTSSCYHKTSVTILDHALPATFGCSGADSEINTSQNGTSEMSQSSCSPAAQSPLWHIE
jgi:hypothetical protein